MILASHGIISSSGGVTFDTDALSFITAAAITDSTQQTAINTLVTDLKTYNIWTKMKALYPMVGGSASAHKFNLKDPRDLDAAYRLQFVNGWTHTSNGALPNGTDAYANTFLNGNQLGQNSESLSAYFASNILGTMGISKNGYNWLYVTNTRIGCPLQVYPSFIDVGFTISTATGFNLANRTSSTNISGYKNNTKLGDYTAASGTPDDISFYLAAFNRGTSIINYSANQFRFASIGDSLTDTEASNFYLATQKFQTTLNRQV